jgi:hypothetical protein
MSFRPWVDTLAFGKVVRFQLESIEKNVTLVSNTLPNFELHDRRFIYSGTGLRAEIEENHSRS